VGDRRLSVGVVGSLLATLDAPRVSDAVISLAAAVWAWKAIPRS